VLFREAAARSAHFGAPLGITQERDERLRDGNMIAGVDEQSGLAVPDGIQRPAHSTRHHWQTVGARFEEDDPKSFATRTRSRQTAWHSENRTST
jgi:hypothetical protein